MSATGIASAQSENQRARDSARVEESRSIRAAAIPGTPPNRPAASAISSLSSYPRWSARGRKQATSDTKQSRARYNRGPVLAPMRPLLSDWSTMPPPDDLRRHPRAPLRLRIDYERMNTFFADYTKNISKGGSFIKTARPLSIGTKFAFSMSVPALSEPVLLQGVVAWIVEPADAAANGGDPGMGIRFIFGSDTQRQDL